LARSDTADGDCVPDGDVYLHHVAATESMAATEIASNIESPCNRVCAIDPASGLCVGCGRSMKEIEGWLRFSDHERRRIMAELSRRLALLGCAGTGNSV
jgi:predicted Fe-S protein YdhL (DUF1289 family)